MTHTHTLADWLEAVSIGLLLSGSTAAVYLLIVEVDFQVRHRLAALHLALVHAGHDVNRALAPVRAAVRASHEALRDLAALLLLLTTSPKGTLR